MCADRARVPTLHEDLVEHAPVPPGTPPGRAGVKALVSAYRSGVPDLTFSLVMYLEQNDLGCAVLRITGTHTGTLLGIAPTGKRIEVDAIDVVRIAEGRAAEHWGASDDLGLLAQPGHRATRGDPGTARTALHGVHALSWSETRSRAGAAAPPRTSEHVRARGRALPRLGTAVSGCAAALRSDGARHAGRC